MQAPCMALYRQGKTYEQVFPKNFPSSLFYNNASLHNSNAAYTICKVKVNSIKFMLIY